MFLYHDGYGFPKAYLHFASSSRTLWMLNERGQAREHIDLSDGRLSPGSSAHGILGHVFFNADSPIIFTNKERKLVMAKGGDNWRNFLPPIVQEQGRLIAQMWYGPDPSPDAWLLSEDGTVWKETGRKLQVFKWRSGKPALAAMATPIVPDEHVLDFPCAPQRSVAALWGDGRYIAVADTHPLLPKSLIPVALKAAALIKQDDKLPFERRRLTLYRNGKKVGTYSVNLKPSGAKYPAMFSTPVPQYFEHIAFSRDGKYLAWCIDAGWGWLELVFKVQ